jgi:tetratricopeptide (TPR) repeat protein
MRQNEPYAARCTALLQRAFCLHQGGRLAEAREIYEGILKVDARQFDALQLLACLLTADDPQRALRLFERAIQVSANYPRVFFNRAVALSRLGRREAAIASYDRAIALKADYAEAYRNRATVEVELGRLAAALVSCEHAVELEPGCAQAHYNHGVVLLALRRHSEAITSLDQAIAIDRGHVEAYVSRGNALQELMRLSDALASYEQAIECNPGFAGAHYNKAITCLLLGDLEAGFREYEWRHGVDRPTVQQRRFRQPLWTGKEPLGGRTMLIHSEQGLGDTLQFCRYASRVAELGAEVWLEVPRPLATLLSSVDGVSRVMVPDRSPPETDLHCPLMSLPLACGTTLSTIPGVTKYLRAEQVKVMSWEARLPSRGQPRIGLVWSGRSEHIHDQQRSIPLADLVAKLPVGLRYLSLQKEVRPSDLGVLRGNPWISDVSEELDDFSDTAALCRCLDLVISVDTSVAHLSGALGVETWVLLPFRPDWRWLLGRADSPWYPSMKLYRQPAAGAWEEVLQRVHDDLHEFARRITPEPAR